MNLAATISAIDMQYAQIAKVAAVIGLVVWAAVLATPPGRLPLALRGLAKIMRRDSPQGAPADNGRPASAGRRVAAFFLILLAIALAVI